MFVFIYEMVSQMWPIKRQKRGSGKQNQTNKKTPTHPKFIILTNPKDSKHSMSCRATWKSHPVVRKQKTGIKGTFRASPILGL